MTIKEKEQAFLYAQHHSLLDSQDRLRVGVLNQRHEDFEQSISTPEYDQWQNSQWLTAVAIPLSQTDQARTLALLAQRTLYHGSPDTEIDSLSLGEHGALFLSHDVSAAQHHAGDDGKVYLNQASPKNPLFVESTDLTYDIEISPLLPEIKAQGYDAIVPLDFGDIVVLDLAILTPVIKKPAPQAWYHGSENCFTNFDDKKRGNANGGEDTKFGFYHSKTEMTAINYTGDVDEPYAVDGETVAKIIAEFNTLGYGLDEWERAVQETTPRFRADDPSSYEKGIKTTHGFIKKSVLSGDHKLIEMNGAPWDARRQARLAREAMNEGYDGVVFQNMTDSGWFNDMEDDIALTFDTRDIAPYPLSNGQPTITPDLKSQALAADLNKIVHQYDDVLTPTQLTIKLQRVIRDHGIQMSDESKETLERSVQHDTLDDVYALSSSLVYEDQYKREQTPEPTHHISEQRLAAPALRRS